MQRLSQDNISKKQIIAVSEHVETVVTGIVAEAAAVVVESSPNSAKETFMLALAAYRAKPDHDERLLAAGTQLAVRLRKEKYTTEVTNPIYGAATNIINDNTADNRAVFAGLISKHENKYKRSKRITGYIYTFLGAAILAAGTALAATIVLMPLYPFLIALGGVSLILASVCFVQGKRKGLDKDMFQFHRAARPSLLSMFASKLKNRDVVMDRHEYTAVPVNG